MTAGKGNDMEEHDLGLTTCGHLALEELARLVAESTWRPGVAVFQRTTTLRCVADMLPETPDDQVDP